VPLSITPVPVPAGSAVPLVLVPPGPATVAVSGGSASAAGIYVGEGTALTAAIGMYVPGGSPPFQFTAYPGQAPQQLYAIASAGTVTACVFVMRPG
jgi:hypothetical protein